MDPGVGEDGGRRQARNTEPVAATNSYVQARPARVSPAGKQHLI